MGPKNLGYKNAGLKENLGQKMIWSKKIVKRMLGPKNVGYKMICVQKTFQGPKKLHTDRVLSL